MTAQPTPPAPPSLPDDPRWQLYPDGDASVHAAPSDADVAEARSSQRRGLARTGVIVAIAILVGVALWQLMPFLVVVAFMGVVAWTLVWHMQHRRRVQAAFETWCARRGLTQSYGQISSMYPSPHGGREEELAAVVLDECVTGRKPRVLCQVRGQLWGSSRPGLISRVSLQVRDDTSEYTVIEVPLEPAVAARYDTDQVTPLGAVTSAPYDGYHGLGEALAAQLASLGAAHAAIHRGRFFVWFPQTFTFYGCAMSVMAESGELKSTGYYAGSAVLFDARLAEARAWYRRLQTA